MAVICSSASLPSSPYASHMNTRIVKSANRLGYAARTRSTVAISDVSIICNVIRTSRGLSKELSRRNNDVGDKREFDFTHCDLGHQPHGLHLPPYLPGLQPLTLVPPPPPHIPPEVIAIVSQDPPTWSALEAHIGGERGTLGSQGNSEPDGQGWEGVTALPPTGPTPKPLMPDACTPHDGHSLAHIQSDYIDSNISHNSSAMSDSHNSVLDPTAFEADLFGGGKGLPRFRLRAPPPTLCRQTQNRVLFKMDRQPDWGGKGSPRFRLRAPPQSL